MRGEECGDIRWRRILGGEVVVEVMRKEGKLMIVIMIVVMV